MKSLTRQLYQGMLLGALLLATSGGMVRAQQTIFYNDGDSNSTPIVLTSATDPTTLTISSGNATQSGNISESGGSYGIIKTGNGNIILSGSNTFSGGLVNNGLGAIEALTAGSLGSGTITLNNGAVEFGDVLPAGTNIANAWVVNNDAVIANTGTNTGLQLSGNIALNNGTLYYIAETDEIQSLTGVISGTGSIAFQGAGNSPIIVGGTSGNTYTGLTSIIGYSGVSTDTVVSLEKTGSLSAISGNIVLGVGSVTSTGSGTVQQILVLNNSLSGTTVVANENEIADSSIITFQGGDGNDAGVLRMLGQSETIGGIQSETVGDGIIQNNGNKAGNVSTLTLNVAGTASYTYTGLIQDHDSSNSNVGQLAITKMGLGTQTLTNTNTYTGATTIQSGVLGVYTVADTGVASSIGAGSTIDLGSFDQLGTLQFSWAFTTNYETNRSFVLAGGGAAGIDISNMGGIPSASTPNGSLFGTLFTVNGSVSGAGTLVKLGSGNLDLRGTDTYTGGTVVDQGLLRFGTTASVPASGLITVKAGGTVGPGYAINQAFLNQISSASTGVVALGADSANNLDFSNLPNAALGALGHYILSGNITPNAAAGYQLGGGGVNLINQGPFSVLNIAQANEITGNHNVTISPHGTAGAGVIFDDTENFVGALNISGAINAETVSPSSFPSNGNYSSSTQAAWMAFGELYLASGSASSLPGVTSVNLNSLGILQVIASASPSDRLPNSTPINFNGGIFGFVNDSSGVSYSETVGPMNVVSGASEVFTSTAASGQTSVLTFSSLSRAAGATMTFAGANLGTTQNQVIFSSTGTMSLSTTRATPWAFVVNSGATSVGSGDIANDFAIFSSSGTIVAANGQTLTAGSAMTAGQDYTITGSTTLTGSVLVLGGSRSANTIRSTLGSNVMISPGTGNTLSVNGLMTASSPNSSYQMTIGVIPNNGTLTSANTTAGPAPRELIINSASANGTGSAVIGITVNSVIADNTGGSVTLVKAGNSNLNLYGTNTFSGGLVVNGLGAVYAQTSSSLGSGMITLNSGALVLGDTTAAGTNITNAWAVNSDAVINNTGTATGIQLSGNMALNGGTLYYMTSANVAQSLTGVISGPGNVTLEGAGSAPIIIGGGSSNTYTGLTSITGRQDGAAQTVVSLEKTGTATAISGNILLGLNTVRSNTGTGPAQEILVLNNSLSGTTVVANENEIADSSVITFQGGQGNDAGVLRMLGQSETIGGIQSSIVGDGIIQNNGNLAGSVSTLTLNTSGTTNYVYGGLIQDHDISNSNAGKLAIVITGSGSQIFNNSNTYSGGTTITGSGALYANNVAGSATGTGSLTLSTGAILGGTGTITSTNNLIQGTMAVGQGNATDTNVSALLKMTATGTTAFSNANLVFNLSATSNAGNELALGATPTVSFSGTNSLTFDLQGTGTIANGTQYTLITTTTSGRGVDGSVFQGITLSGSVITSGLNLNFVNGSYGGSQLVLVADGSGYDIDLVAAVPEPGTWGLMLGGLVLITLLRCKRRSGKI